MSKLTDRASYLRGLAEGLQLDPDKASNRLLLEVIDMLGEVADELEKQHNDAAELNDYVQSIDDDLADLEDALFADDGFDEEPEDEEDDEEEDEDDEDLDGETIISYACPHCGHVLEFNADEIDFDEETLCPECGKPVFPEFSDEEDGGEGEDAPDDAGDKD